MNVIDVDQNKMALDQVFNDLASGQFEINQNEIIAFSS